MSQANVEERITALERTVAELLRGRGPGKRIKDWTRTVGMFSGNGLMKEIDEAGQRIRQLDRQRVRRRSTKSRRNGK